MLVAGEASGDRYAADLVRVLRRRHPDWSFCGMGGAELREAGAEILVDSTELAVVGIVEVLRHYWPIRRALHALRAHLRAQPPDLLVLIDYPEFNLRLARLARARGIPVLFYISPQLWAWRAGRIRKIRKSVDHMAVLFPFEKDFYQTHGVPVSHVGHPLRGQTQASAPKRELRARFGLRQDRPVVGLFPGSRRNELTRLLPVCAGVVPLLRNHGDGVQFVLAQAPGVDRNDYAPGLVPPGQVHLLQGDVYDIIAACDMAVAASGTVTLQLALMGVPFCMIYRLSPLTYRAARMLVRIPRYCLPNIIAGDTLAPELIQDAATPERVAAQLRPWLEDEALRRDAAGKLAAVGEMLGPPCGMERLADCVERLL